MRALIYTSNASVNRKHREYQQALCLRHAGEKGYTVLDIVYDVGRDRPEMERVLDRARAGEFDVLVTINLARLGRHYPAVRALVDEFEAAGITLYLCDQPVASASQLQLMAVMAAFDASASMSKRIRAGKAG